MTGVFIPSVDPGTEAPAGRFLSRTLHNDDHTRIVQFTFAPGAELAAHSAPFPASIYVVSGEGELQLGEHSHIATAGSLAQMPPGLLHAIRARTELVMLLIMNKGARP